MPVGLSDHSRFRNRLEAAGLSLGNTTLPVVSPEWEQLQFAVPPRAVLITEAGEPWIEWETAWDEPLCWTPVPGHCLSSFLRLADAGDAAVLSFAIDWGPLDEVVPDSLDTVMPILNANESISGTRMYQEMIQRLLKKRALPSCLDEIHSTLTANGSISPVRMHELTGYLPTYKQWSPVARWRALARELGATLSVAAALKQHRPVASTDWDDMLWDVEDAEYETLPTLASPVAEQRALVSGRVAGWLQHGNIGVVAQWTEDGFSLTLSTTREITLSSILAIELVASMASPLGMYQCDECGSWYTPTQRKPRTGFAKYCPDCSQAGYKQAKRNWWHKTHPTQPGPTDTPT